MALRVVERTKVCARCKVSKPWSAFQARTRWDDGSARTVIAYCRKCATIKRKESYARRPGSKAASCRRYRERLRDDPVRLADYREKQRIYNRMWHLRRGSDVGKYTEIPTSPELPVEPFVAWLRTLGETPREIAAVCGIARPQVYDYLRGRNRTVSLDVVDRACVHADYHIDCIYPLDNAA